MEYRSSGLAVWLDARLAPLDTGVAARTTDHTCLRDELHRDELHGYRRIPASHTSPRPRAALGRSTARREATSGGVSFVAASRPVGRAESAAPDLHGAACQPIPSGCFHIL